jgi:hypothetical protein
LLISPNDLGLIGDVTDPEEFFICEYLIFLVENGDWVITGFRARMANCPVFGSVIA